MINFKVNGKNTPIPTSWDDLTFRQYYSILTVNKNSDYRSIIAICLNTTLEKLNEYELENVDDLLRHIAFTTKPAVMDPQPYRIGKFIIPRDISLQTLGQYADMKTIMEEHNPREKDSDLDNLARMTEAYPKYAAIYCQKIRDGKYDYDAAMVMAKEFWHYPALEILSAGNFFFMMLSGLKKTTGQTSLQWKLRLKKIKRGFLRLLKRLELA